MQKNTKDNKSHQATALYNIKTVDGSDVIYTTFEEVYEVLLSSDNSPFDEDEDQICDTIDPCVGIYDECGICNGSGIIEGFCDCEGNIDDCAGICGGTTELDDCGVCDGENYFGENFGDLCDCDCNILDQCGVCGGDDSSCTAFLSLGDINASCTSNSDCDGTIDILYDFPGPVSGFQFDISNINITGAYGGITDLLFDTISNSESSIIGFSFEGNQIPAGSGTLLKIQFSSITGPVTAIDDESIVLSYPGGDEQYLTGVTGTNIIHEADCTGVYYNIIDILEGCNGVCGSGWIYDCLGDCISPDQIIYGGGTWEDCNGVCGGDAYLDCAGVCDSNVNNDIGHDYDQDGICDEVDICPGVEYYDFSGTLICLDAELPKELVLKQNFPNPFNPFTNIEFYLDKNQNIEIIIYNVKGRKIKNLV